MQLVAVAVEPTVAETFFLAVKTALQVVAAHILPLLPGNLFLVMGLLVALVAQTLGAVVVVALALLVVFLVAL
jgi:hypothetical protein